MIGVVKMAVQIAATTMFLACFTVLLLLLCLWGFVERFRHSRMRATGDKQKQGGNRAMCGCSEPNGLRARKSQTRPVSRSECEDHNVNERAPRTLVKLRLAHSVAHSPELPF
jgi:hypothetical protein